MKYWKSILRFTLFYWFCQIILSTAECLVFSICTSGTAMADATNMLALVASAVFISRPRNITRADISRQDTKLFAITLAGWTIVLPQVGLLVVAFLLLLAGQGQIIQWIFSRWAQASPLVLLSILSSQVLAGWFVMITVQHSLNNYFRKSVEKRS